MSEEMRVQPIGFVRGGRAQPTDDHWGKEKARIELDASRFGPEAVLGLAEFSHIEVVFFLDRVDPSRIETGARHPRGRAEWREVGIFAQRAKARPNRLGVSRCRLLAVEGLALTVEGLDAIDGTPVLDVKPWLSEFGPRGEVRQPRWATELMRLYYD